MRHLLLAVLVSISLVGAKVEAATFDFVWDEIGGSGQAVGQVTFAGGTYTGGPATSLIFQSVSVTGFPPALIADRTVFGRPTFDWVTDPSTGSLFTGSWGIGSGGLPTLPVGGFSLDDKVGFDLLQVVNSGEIELIGGTLFGIATYSA